MGRTAAVLLLLAFPAAPTLAQSDELSIAPPIALPEANDWDPDRDISTDLDALDGLHAAYLADQDLQLVRPESDPIEFETTKPPNWLVALLDFLSFLGPLLKYLFYICIGLFVLAAVYFLFGEAMRIRFGRDGSKADTSEDDVIPDYRPEEGLARSLLEEADALARAERFAEAVHLLLFRSIEDIQTRVETGVPRSLTAREIGKLGFLPERVRAALGPIIAIVERSFFGGRPVDESGWHQARASYEAFAFGEEWA